MTRNVNDPNVDLPIEEDFESDDENLEYEAPEHEEIEKSGIRGGVKRGKRDMPDVPDETI